MGTCVFYYTSLVRSGQQTYPPKSSKGVSWIREVSGAWSSSTKIRLAYGPFTPFSASNVNLKSDLAKNFDNASKSKICYQYQIQRIYIHRHTWIHTYIYRHRDTQRHTELHTETYIHIHIYIRKTTHISLVRGRKDYNIYYLCVCTCVWTHICELASMSVYSAWYIVVDQEHGKEEWVKNVTCFMSST